MIVLGNSVALCGVAGTGAAVTISVFGSSTVASVETPKQLYQGVLPSSVGTLFAAGGSEVCAIKTLMLANSTGSPVTGVRMFVGGTGSGNAISPLLTIPANGSVVYDGAAWSVSDGAGNIQQSITVAANSIDNTKLAQAGAYTLKGNPTASTANEQDIALSSGNMSALANLTGTNTGDQTVPALSSATPTAETSGIAGAAGVAATSSRSDHVHALPTLIALAATTPSTLTSGGSAVVGTDAGASHADHVHAMPTIPALSSTTPTAETSGVAGAVGTGTTSARADHVHGLPTLLALAATTPSTQAFGDSAVVGTDAGAAHADHKHTMPAAPTASSVGLGSVTNDAQTKAAIVPNTAPSSGQVLVGNAGGTAYAPVTASADVTVASTGAMTIAAGAVTLSKQANLAANSIIGNNTGSPATPLALTVAQVQALLLAQPRGTQSIALAGSTTTLTNASPRQTIFTGSGATAQTVVLPDATTIPFVDWTYEIDNSTTGTGIVTVQTNGGATLWTVGPGAGAAINLLTKAVAAGTWDVDAYPTNLPTGKSNSTGLFVKQTVYTTGSAATHTYQAGISSAIIEGVAGGGGGGGGTFSSPNMSFGGGGAAGGYFSVRVTAGLTTATYTVGAAGTAGANTGGTGGTGGDTIVVHNSVTYTAKGGLGGVGQTAATTLDSALGGAGVAGTNGDILSPGACGANSVRFSGILGSSGAGAASIYGGGGGARKTNGNGNNGTGYGSGGGGAAAVSASVTGGTGIAGIVIITEYT